MVAGLEDITSGTLRLGGQVVNDLSPKDRNVAMVFQSYALYPHMTVRREHRLRPRLRKMPKDQVRAKVAATAKPSACPSTSTASPASSRVASARGWPWAGPWCENRRCS